MFSPNVNIANLFCFFYLSAIAIGSMLVLIFILQYTEKGEWLKGKRIFILFIIPALSIVLLGTNQYHHFFFRKISYVLKDNYLFFDTTTTINGPWFFVHAVYSYMLLMIGAIILVRVALNSFKPFKSQSLALLIGLLIPFISSLISTLKFVDVILSSLAFTFSGIAFTYALFWHQWLDLSPIARGIIFDNLNDCMIVIDLKNRIVDYNDAAHVNLQLPSDSIIGKSAEMILHRWNELILHLNDNEEYKSEMIIEINQKVNYFDLRISPITNVKGIIIGKIISMRDITNRKNTEEILKKSLIDKDILLKELNHRTKNNLQVISSMLELKSSLIDDNDVKFIFQSMIGRIHAMSMIHKKLYISKDLTSVNLNEYIYELSEMLLRYISNNEKNIKIEYSMNQVKTGIDTAINIGLILSELFSNAFKYAFTNKNNGVISISLSQTDNDSIEVTFKDDGVGFHEGIDFESFDSLGINIILSLAKQLKGTAEFSNDNGVLCRLHVPV